MVFALGLITPTVSASLISTDLSITATAGLSLADSVSAIGSASQRADINAIFGGNSLLTTVNDVTPVGTNPLGGILTDFGDGVGVDALVSSTSLDVGEAPDFIFDLGFSLMNSSVTDTYQIFFALAFSTFADADGPGTYDADSTDVYVDAEVNLFDNLLSEMFASDSTSDFRFGDEVNGVGQITSGATLSDSGTFLFDITLAAGAVNNFSALVKMDGAAFSSDAFFNGRSSAFISVLSADNLTAVQPPLPVPEPSTLMLFLGVAVLWQVKQVKRRTNS
jgi:hypothetical protein